MPAADLSAVEETKSAVDRAAVAQAAASGLNGAIFERMVIVLPYRAPESVKLIEETFESINIEGLGLENARYLNTKELSDEEKKDRTLDFLGGFEIMDAEFRMFIIEGLGGEGKAMDKFYKINARSRPNDKKFKMLYNPEVRYKNRLYQEFNCSMKRIRMRDSLTKIMGSPDVYLRSKVPEDMYDTLQKFAEIRKLDRVALVRDFNLFPRPVNLLTLERKYGDALSFEDINGYKQRKKKRASRLRDTSVAANSQDDTTEAQSEWGRATTITGTTPHATIQPDLRKNQSQNIISIATRNVPAQGQDESDSEDEIVDVPKRLKAPTDSHNTLF